MTLAGYGMELRERARIEVDTVATLTDASGGTLVLPVFSGPVAAPLMGVDVWPLDGVEVDYEALGFGGDRGQAVTLVNALPGFDAVVLVGLGAEADAETVRRASAASARVTQAAVTVVSTLSLLDIEGAADAAAFGFLAGAYRYDELAAVKPPLRTRSLILVGESAGTEGATLAQATAMVRDLVNRPANLKPPKQLAAWAAVELGALGIEVDIWDEGRIAEESLGALLAVSAGSSQPPRFVKATYRPEGATARLALVGKGIVFDSGGLSIKPADGMMTMKTDMAGAATVLGALWAIATLGIQVEVTAYAPLSENMVGASAMRPGDVIRARNGTTIEVLNTDAEGRLILADALVLAAEDEPDLIVDVATLTGACKVALGVKMAGLFASDDESAASLDGAARRAGEGLWRLPLEEEARAKLDSPIADLKNIGDRWGGAGTAALFLREFTDGRAWAHLDIAGPARVETPEHYLALGASGFGVRTLVALAQDFADS